MTWARKLGQNLADAPPFQMSALTIALFRGITYVTGFLPATTAEQGLPHWLLVFCLIELSLAAVMALVGVIGHKWFLERLGLTLLVPSAFAYALVLEYQRPHEAALSFVIYTALSLASLLRLLQMKRILDAVRRVDPDSLR